MTQRETPQAGAPEHAPNDTPAADLAPRRSEELRARQRRYDAAWKARNPEGLRDSQRRYRQKNLEKHRQHQARYRERHPEQAREASLRARFGIGLEDYDTLLAAQEGVCAACRRPESRVHSRTKQTMMLAVDHCHRSGRVRGLLCASCNTALGLLADDVNRIMAAAIYLERHA